MAEATTRGAKTSVFNANSMLTTILLASPALLSSAYYQVFPAGTDIK
jgi:hypothetical protein